MNLSLKIKDAFKSTRGVLWLMFVPLSLDFASLLVYTRLLEHNYAVPQKTFLIKLGTISCPPGAQYIFDNFPSLSFGFNNNYGSFGVVNSINLFNIFYLLSFILIYSFLKSGFLGCLERAGEEQINHRDFLVLGNKYWFKIFILESIKILPVAVFLYDKSFFILPFLTVIFYYVDIAIIVDRKSMGKSFGKGINVFLNNLGITIKMALYYGFLMSLLSPLYFTLGRLNGVGLYISIILIDYFGIVVCKAIIEVYRGLKESRYEEADKCT